METNAKDRAKCLVLCSSSTSAKTACAASLGTHEETLVVDCQGLGDQALPNISSCHRLKKRIIIWDEVSYKQVLHNKKLFQSGPYLIELGDSACHQHAYSILPYNLQHILCTNWWPTTEEELQKLSPADADYLRKNFFHAILPPTWKWYLEDDEPDVICENPQEAAVASEKAEVTPAAAAGGA